MDTPSVEEFLAQRPRLFRLAYRMLGEAGEAEDVVQDEYLRWAGAVRAEIAYPSAWLTKVVTNLCLSRLTSARARRENYVGPWLPETVLTADGALGPLETVEQRDSVSLALLRLMEQLTPTERAVFVLREALPTTIGRSPSFSTSRRPTPGSFMTGPGSASGRGHLAPDRAIGTIGFEQYLGEQLAAGTVPYDDAIRDIGGSSDDARTARATRHPRTTRNTSLSPLTVPAAAWQDIERVCNRIAMRSPCVDRGRVGLVRDDGEGRHDEQGLRLHLLRRSRDRDLVRPG